MEGKEYALLTAKLYGDREEVEKFVKMMFQQAAENGIITEKPSSMELLGMISDKKI